MTLQSGQMPIAVDNWGILLCPICNFEYTHHSRIEIFDRGLIDDYVKEGLHVVVDECGKSDNDKVHGKKTVVVNDDVSDNPSGRRNGLRINFWCENGEHHSQLVIAQQKGCTHIYWEKLFE